MKWTILSIGLYLGILMNVSAVAAERVVLGEMFTSAS